MTDVLQQLTEALGANAVRSAATPAQRTDWTGHVGGPVAAVVLPRTTDDVVAVLRIATATGTPVQTQGGNTGLVGGGIPPTAGPEPILLSTARMSGVVDLDAATGQLTAWAGTPLAEVQAAARAAGWVYGVDLAARDSATIGGTVATNAGGIRVCAYGSTRAQLLGVEAVAGGGSVIADLPGLTKDNTGYDLAGLLCGSEGTLAVVTRVRVRLHRPPPASTLAALPVADLAEASALAAGAAAPGVPLLAAEMVDAGSWRGCAEQSQVPDPLARVWAGSSAGARPVAGAGSGLRTGAPIDDMAGAGSSVQGGYVLLVEVGDGGDGSGFAAAITDRDGAAVAVSASEQRALWRLREGQTDYWVARGGALHKFDVSLPAAGLDPAVAQVRDHAARIGGAVGVFGHIREGNLHLQLRLPAVSGGAGAVVQSQAAAGGRGVASFDADGGQGAPAGTGGGGDRSPTDPAAAVLPLVARLGGSVSAEHGIGRDKAAFLHLRRSSAEIALMRAIKAAWDPHGILNPGVLLP